MQMNHLNNGLQITWITCEEGINKNTFIDTKEQYLVSDLFWKARSKQSCGHVAQNSKSDILRQQLSQY